MAAVIALGCACAVVFVVTLITVLRKGRNALISEAARLLEIHDHGVSARGKYRGLRFVIDAGSPEDLRAACAYGGFLSSATGAAEKTLKGIGGMLGLGRKKTISLRMRVELRNAGDPALDAASAAARTRKFLAEKFERGRARATNQDTELSVFLHDVALDDAPSGAALLKEVADRVVETAEALKAGDAG